MKDESIFHSANCKIVEYGMIHLAQRQEKWFKICFGLIVKRFVHWLVLINIIYVKIYCSVIHKSDRPTNIEKKYYILAWSCKKVGHCIYILFYCFLNKLSSTMNGNKMYYNNPVTGRLSFEKFVIRRDFRKTNLHAEETHRGFSSHYKFSLGCFCTNKYNNATRSWKLLINWDWKPLSNSV